MWECVCAKWAIQADGCLNTERDREREPCGSLAESTSAGWAEGALWHHAVSRRCSALCCTCKAAFENVASMFDDITETLWTGWIKKNSSDPRRCPVNHSWLPWGRCGVGASPHQRCEWSLLLVYDSFYSSYIKPTHSCSMIVSVSISGRYDDERSLWTGGVRGEKFFRIFFLDYELVPGKLHGTRGSWYLYHWNEEFCEIFKTVFWP